MTAGLTWLASWASDAVGGRAGGDGVNPAWNMRVPSKPEGTNFSFQRDCHIIVHGYYSTVEERFEFPGSPWKGRRVGKGKAVVMIMENGDAPAQHDLKDFRSSLSLSPNQW